MSLPPQYFSTNILLRAISQDDIELLKPFLTRVPLPLEMLIVARNEPIEHVYFPEGGVVSIVSVMARGRRIEGGLFGREGVSATCLLLGTDRSPHETFVQVEGGSALRIETGRYLDAIRQSDGLRIVLLRYVQTMLVQAAQSTAANAGFRVEARLARWLLMCHDRIDGDEIALTHEVIGKMISAERSGVTVTLHILEGEGMIRARRGRVTILDRAKLEELASDSYGVAEAEYRKLIGPLGRSARFDVPDIAARR